MKNKVWFMTPKQEIMNSITMGLPLSFGIHYYLKHQNNLTIEQNKKMLCLLFSMIGHAPFSMYYHYRCMKRNMKHPIYNTWHALDHTFMHAMTPFVVYANSGSLRMTLIAGIINGIFIKPHLYTIYDTWGDNKNLIIDRDYVNSHNIRRRNISISILMANLPFLLRKENKKFYKSIFISSISFLPFTCNGLFKGWGSSIMHLGMLPVSKIMLQSI